jgi:uroporphyrin-3 C-methyltransferase
MVDDNVRPPSGPANSVPIEGSGVADVPPVAPASHGPAAGGGVAPARASSNLTLGGIALVALAVVSVAAGVLSWQTQQRVRQLEQELVRRQQGSTEQAAEAKVLAKQAQDVSRDAAAKAALLEARVAEVALQRTQLEELIQSLSRSRDENLVTDIEAALRVAMQQTAITGSAEPLVASLRTAEERLARVANPRLEGVRRALTRDLDRVRSVGIADLGGLVIRLDEAVRLVDDLPLLSSAVPPVSATAGSPPPSSPRNARSASRAVTVESAASASAASTPPAVEWRQWIGQWGNDLWNEVRALVRVTRIDRPEAMLVSPEQGFFLRENLKLRLLNARLALLSRQFDTAQSDLANTQSAVQRYFDPTSRKTVVLQELLKSVQQQSRQVTVPRPDETLAALTAAAAGR